MKLSVNHILICIAVIVFSITAYYSAGYFHADEHYQIIEFAGLKAGWNVPNDLVWEYHTQIRPALLPTIAYGFFSIFKFFGITDPYTTSFLLREITALLLLVALVFFFRNTNRFIRSAKFPQYDKFLHGLYLGFLLLIWYVPFLGVRFSSENWSAIFLVLGMACFCSEKKTRRTPFLVGIFFGLSFLFRFQIAFAIIGFGIWFLIFNRKNIRDLLPIVGMFLLIFCFGILIDSWYYGKFVISSWNYFDQNILQQKAAEFGESPWNYYLSQIFHLPTKLIGTLIFLSLGVTLVFRVKSVFIWMILSFILFHMMIGHKEERFLFPMAYFLPVFFVYLFQLLIDFIPKKIGLGLVVLTSLGILTTSIVGLPILATTSAGLGRMGTTHFIHTQFKDKPVNLIALPYSDPYAPWFRFKRFYLDPNVNCVHIDNFDQLDPHLLKQKDTINLLVTTKFFLVNYPHAEKIKQLKFKKIHQSVPEIQLKMNKYVRGLDDLSVTYLYELKN